MVSWALVNTVGVPLGIFLLRNGFTYYRSIQASYASRGPTIRPTPPKTARSLNLLFTFAVIALLYTLPYFSPSNVIKEAHATATTPTEVIFTRLAALRPLTPLDEALKSRFTSKNARLIYLTYGPNAVATCTFCSYSDAQSYFYYSLPTLAAPHLLHLAVLGISTSPLFSGPEGARWRGYATLAAVALAVADVYFYLNHDVNANHAANSARDVDHFFWRMRVARGVSIAFVDGLLGWIMWLASTNRFFLAPPSFPQRVEAVSRALDMSNFHLWSTGNVRNTIVRDRELRDGMIRYWSSEKELYESRDVVDAIKSALERTDMRSLSDNADQRSTDILRSLGA